jgi:uncharacterized protein
MKAKAIANRTVPPPERPSDDDVPDTDSGTANRTTLRRCIVTRTVGPPDGMIRFVMAPDGTMVPDLKRRLPGRGAWVTAQRATVAEAVRRGAFARALRRPVQAAADLADQVADRLRETALGALGLERRAGRLAVGFGEVDALLRRGGARLVLHAAEAAADGMRKIDQAAHAGGDRPEICRAFTAAELGLALGGGNVIHAALERGRGSDAAARRCLAYELYLADAGEHAGRI